MVPRVLVLFVLLASLPYLLPASASTVVDTAVGQGGAVPAGAFGTVLRTYQESGGGLQYDLLRLEAHEEYDDYYFQVDAGPGVSPEAAAALLRVRRIGTQDQVCQGAAAQAGTLYVLRDCDDLIVLHHYEVEWMVDRPASVLRLKAY